MPATGCDFNDDFAADNSGIAQHSRVSVRRTNHRSLLARDNRFINYRHAVQNSAVSNDCLPCSDEDDVAGVQFGTDDRRQFQAAQIFGGKCCRSRLVGAESGARSVFRAFTTRYAQRFAAIEESTVLGSL